MSLVLQGEVERVVYQNDENNYCVVRMRIEGRVGYTTVVGAFHDLAVGEFLCLTGEWVHHKRFGEQFKVDRYESVIPTSESGIERFLSSGIIKGIGPELARRIVETFGEDTFDILDNHPARLREVEGIGAHRHRETIKRWQEQQQTRTIMFGLQELGISVTYATRVFKRYGAQSLEVVQGNPYVLAEEIFGIGFKRADAIAQHLGVAADSPLRLRAGVTYVLKQFVDDGHVYCPYEKLIDATAEILGCERDPVTVAVADAQRQKDVFIVDLTTDADDPAINNKGVYLSRLYYAEVGIAARLEKLVRDQRHIDTSNSEHLIDECLDQLSIEFAPAQRNAVAAALAEKVLVITGGPGTGKTTIVNAIIQLFARWEATILMAAPTGRAAKRLSETTGREARTIHMMLEFNFQNGFQRNADNRLEADVVIVDEASMIDTPLMNNLLKAIPVEARLILVGDVNQLPSVGPGNVLQDFIASQTVRVVELREIFRQEEKSLIVRNAHRINQGKSLYYARDEHHERDESGSPADFFFIEEDDPGKVLDYIKRLCKERIPQKFKLHPTRDIQVMSPMYKGIVGVENLNSELQGLFNPQGEPIRQGLGSLRLGDKVMQVRNNYEKEVFNGDIGWVTEVAEDDQLLLVDFDGRPVTYEFSELGELVLSYAVSVHKSQGSEYPAIVLPLLPQHYLLLQRNLLYTAVTRARNLVVIVGAAKALDMAIHNDRVMHRYTDLERRLRDELPALGGHSSGAPERSLKYVAEPTYDDLPF